MKPKVYLETTIPSYLTAWRSRDLIRAAHQEITREWWEHGFEPPVICTPDELLQQEEGHEDG